MPEQTNDSVTDRSSDQIDDCPSTQEIQWLDDELSAFNKAQTGFDDTRPIQLVVRRGDRIVAGLKGVTGWEWLHIQQLFVASAVRGEGIGSRLLMRAEQIARSRGCVGSCLSSFCFQAPSFYCRRGYESFGRIPDYPANKTLFFLSKRFLGDTST